MTYKIEPSLEDTRIITQPMVRTQDGSGYGADNPPRRQGPSEAAKRGAVAYLVTADHGDPPHGDGGAIVIGLDEHGRPTGRVYPEDVESALRQAEAMCRPPIHTGWEQIDLAGSALIAVSVARSAELQAESDELRARLAGKRFDSQKRSLRICLKPNA